MISTFIFDSGSFTSEDQAYKLMFRENRIVDIILRVSPWPAGYGDANWTVYSRPLPSNLGPSDRRKEVEGKLGKPTKPNGDRWVGKTTEVKILVLNDQDLVYQYPRESKSHYVRRQEWLYER